MVLNNISTQTIEINNLGIKGVDIISSKSVEGNIKLVPYEFMWIGTRGKLVEKVFNIWYLKLISVSEGISYLVFRGRIVTNIGGFI